MTLASGYGKVHDQGYTVDKTLDTTAPTALCLKQGGCKCPDGSPGASEHTTQATGPISVGANGGDQHLAVYAAGTSLDRYCKKPDPQPPTGNPPPPGGGGGGGGSVPEPDPQQPTGTTQGDPHLTTFDGTTYDLQTAGEMVLAKSTTDDFEVQVRSVPLAGSNRVSVNQQIATRLDGHRLTVSLENANIVARLDGTPIIDEKIQVGTGSVERLGTQAGVGYRIEWADGTTVKVTPLALFGLNATVVPAAARQGKLVGLLGNDDGKATNDFVLADGTSLGSAPSPDTIRGAYGDSWRVTQADSLFDYGAGQTTDTFTDKAYPTNQLTAGNAADRATLTKQCQGEGITDPYLLQSCVVDASATGSSPVVLGHYAHAQTIHTVHYDQAHGIKPIKSSSGATNPTPTTEAGPSPTGTEGSAAALRTIVDSGRISSPKEDATFDFPAKKGDVIWIGPPGCDNQLVVALKDPSGKVLNADDVSLGLSGCLMGRFVLTTSGTYHLVANADHKGTGSYGIPIRFERPDVVRSTSYGKTLSGTIPMTAAHDVYKFSAHAGDRSHISGRAASRVRPPCGGGPGGQRRNHHQLGQGAVPLGCEKASTTSACPTTGTYKPS